MVDEANLAARMKRIRFLGMRAAVTGDESGRLNAGTNLTYVREDEQRQTGAVYGTVSARNLAVWTDELPDGSRYIFTPDYIRATPSFGSAVDTAAMPQLVGDTSINSVLEATGRVMPVDGSLVAKITPFQLPSGRWSGFEQIPFDTTAIGTHMHRWTVFGVDPVNLVGTVIYGTAVAMAAALSLTELGNITQGTTTAWWRGALDTRGGATNSVGSIVYDTRWFAPGVMVGTDGTLVGVPGLVPKPSASDATNFLRGDGEWAGAAAYYQTVQDDGSDMTQRNNLNFIAGDGMTVTVTDNSGGDSTDVTITAGASEPRYLAVYNYRNGTEPKIGLATSNDGRTFTRLTEPLLTFGAGGAQDDTHLAHPCIVENDVGHLYLYYGGYDGTNYAVMLARSFDRGTTWTKYGTVLSSGVAWESSNVSWARVMYDREEANSAKRWKMWYIGANGTGGIGYAYSADGLSWTKYASNPVVALGAGGTWDDTYIITGDIVRLGSTHYLFYGGAGTTTTPDWSAGYVTFTDPEGTYTKSADNPFLVGDGIEETVSSNITAGDTSIVVGAAASFPIGAPVWIYDNSSVTNKMLTIVTDRIDATHIRIRDAATHNFTTAQNARVRSAAYNGIVPVRAMYDGGWIFATTPFIPGFWTSYIHEVSMFAYSKDLSEAWIDYAAGLIIPITADESDLSDVSFENPYIFDLQPWTARFQKETGDAATTALSNLAAVAVNTSLVSDTDSTDNLGSTSVYWANGYIDTLYLTEQAAPSTPASGKGVVYPKTDGKVYFKNDGGTEYDLTGSGGGITVAEADGTPSVGSVTTIVVTNGKLTDDGGGQVTLDLTGGAAGPYTAPSTTGWSWLNQGTSTIDSTSERQYLEAPASATFQIRGRYRDQPTVPYTITAAFKGVTLDNLAHFGFLWFDGTTEAMTFGMIVASSGADLYRVWYKWDDFDTLNGGSPNYFLAASAGMHLNPLWLRISDDNTNIKVYYSADGENFIELSSQARTNFLTPSKVGFFVCPGATNKASVTLLSWEET